MQEEEARQIKENYNILNSTDLKSSNTINYYDKRLKLFELKFYDKIQQDKYLLIFYKESKSQQYYFKIDLRYNIIISID